MIALFSCGLIFLPLNTQKNQQTIEVGQEETQAVSGNWDDYASTAGFSVSGTTIRISTAEGLAYFSKNIATYANYTVIQQNNIDLSAHYWTPIGYDYDYRFTGSYDGQGYAIDGLYSRTDLSIGGFFGYINGATLNGIIVRSGEINVSSGTAGGICANGDGGFTISNCANYANINGKHVGGILGSMQMVFGLNESDYDSSSIYDCYNRGNLTSSSSTSWASYVHIGGIAGNVRKFYNSETNQIGSVGIRRCYNTGNISYTGTATNYVIMGGILGYHSMGAMGLYCCFNLGAVTCSSTVTDQSDINAVVGQTAPSETPLGAIASIGTTYWGVNCNLTYVARNQTTSTMQAQDEDCRQISGFDAAAKLSSTFLSGRYFTINGTQYGWGLVAEERWTYNNNWEMSSDYNDGYLYLTIDKNDQSTLSVDANGGTYNGTSSISTYTQNIGTTRSISSPSRTGYSLGAWVLDGGGTISTFGKLHDSYTDPFFMDGTNGTREYNNSGNGTVTHQYLASSNAEIELPTGARILRIKNAGTSSPGLGGFTNWLPTEANHIFYTIIYAKIPKGYSIQFGTNSLGTNGSSTWLTDKAGTGDWQVYINKIQCGTDKGSTTNFYYINGGANGTTSNPVVWDVAYFGTYDATGLSASGSSSTTPTFTYPASNSSIVALWNRSSVTVTINPDGGSYNGSTSNSSISAKYRDLVNLEVPTKTGYTFKGWQITSGSGTITNTQYLWEERSFDGVDDYIALGRDQMYTDKITVSVLAYMDNWAEYGANVNAMRLISCTEGGGWNIESDSSGNIQVAMYDSGIGYKNVTTTKPWSSLSAGWHDFTFSFDGRNARLFIDDAQIACSAEFTSGKIGYYSNNVIFIGAEAGWTTTTPVDGYFKGLIKSVVIINDYALGSYNVHDAGGYLIPQGNVTVKALWEETWAVNYTKPSGKGTEEDPYQVGSASDLAYFAYKTQILGEQCYDHIVLTRDIDLAGYDWLPMGRARGTNTGFRGTFDGQGHTISNLNVNVSGIAKNTEYGLFGLVDSGAVLKDFTILSGEVNGIANSTGAVAGYIWSATIDNVTNYANVTGNSYIGGIVGQMTRGTTISNCFNYGNVQGINYVGGVVGGTEDSTATRSIVGVTNMGQVSGHSQVGGIIGRAYHVTVESAYNGYTASVTATTRYAGGVVGYLMNGSTVLKSVNTADVAGLECVAGLLGGAVNGGSLTTSYSEGLISARGSQVTEVGSLVGSASTGMVITDCYFKGTSNISIGTFYGSAYTPASISNCYVILNGTKTKTAGSFANWTIISSINDGDPIQKELYHLAGIGGDDELLDAWVKTNNILTDSSFEYGDWSAQMGTSGLSTEHARSGQHSWRMTEEGASYGETYSRTITAYEIDPTHIYFVRLYAYQEVQHGGIQAYWQDKEPSIGSATLGTAGQWNMYGWRFDRVGFSGSHPFRIDFDNHNQVGELWVDDVLLVDLTEMYGAGNEPSQEECMRLFA